MIFLFFCGMTLHFIHKYFVTKQEKVVSQLFHTRKEELVVFLQDTLYYCFVGVQDSLYFCIHNLNSFFVLYFRHSFSNLRRTRVS